MSDASFASLWSPFKNFSVPVAVSFPCNVVYKVEKLSTYKIIPSDRFTGTYFIFGCSTESLLFILGVLHGAFPSEHHDKPWYPGYSG